MITSVTVTDCKHAAIILRALAGPRNLMPVLKWVRIDGTGLSAHRLDYQAHVGTVVVSSAPIVVHPQDLLSILPSTGPTTLRVDERRLVCETGSSCDLQDIHDLPKDLVCDADAAAAGPAWIGQIRLLRWVAHAMSNDTARDGLCGVHINAGVITATDRHRLHATQPPTSPLTYAAGPLIDGAATKMFLALAPKSGDVTITAGVNTVALRCGGVEVVATINSERPFPRVDAVYRGPDSDAATVSLANVALRGAWELSITDGRATARQKADGIVKSVSLTATDVAGKATIEVLGRYLSEAVAGAACRVGVGGPREPIRVDRADGACALVMPQRPRD